MIIKLKLTTTFCFYFLFYLYSGIVFSGTTEEFTVKAAFMVKMTHFIEWPDKPTSLVTKKDFTICIDHSQTRDGSLEKWALTGTIKKKPVKIKYFKNKSTNLKSCDILFISQNNNLDFFLQQAKKNYFLTISDIPGNAARGVIVNFTKKEGKLRFEINLTAAINSGFKLNPRLLKLATIVNSEVKNQ